MAAIVTDLRTSRESHLASNTTSETLHTLVVENSLVSFAQPQGESAPHFLIVLFACPQYSLRNYKQGVVPNLWFARCRLETSLLVHLESEPFKQPSLESLSWSADQPSPILGLSRLTGQDGTSGQQMNRCLRLTSSSQVLVALRRYSPS